MANDDHCFLLRKRPGSEEFKVIGQGTKTEMLLHFANQPKSWRSQYSMTVDGKNYGYLNIEKMAQGAGLLDQ